MRTVSVCSGSEGCKAGRFAYRGGGKAGRFAYVALAHYGGFRSRLGRPRLPKHKELHQDKCDCGGRRDSEEFSDQDVCGEARQAKVHDGDGGQPTGKHNREILYELPNIVAAPALEHPHFVQQEMAGDGSKVGYRDGHQRR